MAQRVFDPSPAVRRRHVEVLGAWCLAMPDRCWPGTVWGAAIEIESIAFGKLLLLLYFFPFQKVRIVYSWGH